MSSRVRMVALGLLVLLLAGCMPSYPRPAPGSGWNRHTVPEGSHSANVARGARAPKPILGFTDLPGRSYHFIFNPSARYTITEPTQPEDQFDWNKLPGLSDCGDWDLSENGLMFAWRWRLDTDPQVLELAAYANNDGVHLWSDEALLTLTLAQLEARRPIWFRLRISPDRQSYEFTIRAMVGGDEVVVSDELPRSCPDTPRTVRKWAGGFYFGGTSVAPQRIRGHMHERR